MWEPKSQHIELLTELFDEIELKANDWILDAGSGRTSLRFLTDKFPECNVMALVYPGDERKKRGMVESVSAKSYVLVEKDILQFEASITFQVVLAHLLLGEAELFGAGFEPVVAALLQLPSKHFVIVDIADDPQVDIHLLLKYLSRSCTIHQRINNGKYFGFRVSK